MTVTSKRKQAKTTASTEPAGSSPPTTTHPLGLGIAVGEPSRAGPLKIGAKTGSPRPPGTKAFTPTNTSEPHKPSPATTQSVYIDPATTLTSSKGFQLLTRAEQNLFKKYVGGSNQELSQQAKSSLFSAFVSNKFNINDPNSYRKELSNQKFSPKLFINYQAKKDTTVNIKETPKGTSVYKFESGAAKAQTYQVTVGKQRLQVILPLSSKSKDGTLINLEQIKEGLRYVGPKLLKNVQTIVVEPGRNPNDSFWAKEYGIKDLRSQMSGGLDSKQQGKITVYPYPRKIDTTVLGNQLLHESGHILSSKNFKANEWASWKFAINKDVLAPSGYAKESKLEDLAESVVMYQTSRGTKSEGEFRQMFPNRYKILDRYLK